MLDGGIADSIPVTHAMERGCDNCLVVLTRNEGYRKPAKRSFVPPFFYSRYGALREAISSRNLRYNSQMELVERLEAEGRVTIVRPVEPLCVGRMERDTQRLKKLYDEGYSCAAAIEFR